MANYTDEVANTDDVAEDKTAETAETAEAQYKCDNCGEPATIKVDLDDDIIEWYACSESCYIELVNFYNEVFG